MRLEILGDLPCEFLASVEVGRFRTRLQYASLLITGINSLYFVVLLLIPFKKRKERNMTNIIIYAPPVLYLVALFFFNVISF